MDRFIELARALMRSPAAPFHEGGVRGVVEELCEAYGLPCRRDRYGNVIVRLPARVKGRQPIVLAAHMDHPGFELTGRIGPDRWRSRFLGGVPDRYFKKGRAVRLFPGGIKGVLERKLAGKKEWEIRTSNARAKEEPSFAVWDLEAFAVRKGLVHGRACDDLIGVAAILATLIEVKGARNRGEVVGVISRAEEVGFVGALAVAEANVLPKRSLIISLETSKEIPGVKMGEGVIVRVGDRSTVFDSDSTRYLSVFGESMKTKGKGLYQRALMAGGSCEGTAYQAYGFQTAAVCVALGNYHNCGAGGRLQAEFVSLADAHSMVELLVGSVKRMGDYGRMVGKLSERLEGLLRGGKGRLLGGR